MFSGKSIQTRFPPTQIASNYLTPPPIPGRRPYVGRYFSTVYNRYLRLATVPFSNFEVGKDLIGMWHLILAIRA